MSTNATYSQFAALLQEEQQRLKNELADLGFANAADTGLNYDANFADTSQVTAERGESGALAAELRHSLAEVESALSRIDAGTYGRCVVCSKEINPDRLEAMPAVTTCIDHAKTARN